MNSPWDDHIILRHCDKINGRNALAVYYMKIMINELLQNITSIQGQCVHKCEPARKKMAHSQSRGDFDFLADPTPLGK